MPSLWKSGWPLCLISLFMNGAVQADEPFIIGVGTHLLNANKPSTTAMQLVGNAGIQSVRDDAFWSTAEPRPGQLQIAPAWKTYLANAQAQQLSTLLILGYGNQFYDNNAKPRTPKVKTAFANYVDFVTRGLGKQVDFYEIWNEWDLEDPTSAPFSSDYATLIKDTTQQIRAIHPQVKILAGAVSSQGIEGGFADRLVEAGILDTVDGLSLHPYVHCRGPSGNKPESWIAWLRQIDARLSAKAGKPIALYLTEMGWPSHDGHCGISEQTQAAYLARSFFLAQTLPSIKGMWWYDLINDGNDRQDQEHNFGLLNPDLTAKPAYQTLLAISPTLRQYRYDAAASSLTEHLYLLNFSNGVERVVVAWTTDKPRPVTIVASSAQTGFVRLIDTAKPEQGQISSQAVWTCLDGQCSAPVELSNFPKIISVGTTHTLSTR